MFPRQFTSKAESSPAILPSDVFDELLQSDLHDNSVSFTVYLINPKIAPNVKYAYRSVNSASCYTSLLLRYTTNLQYMLLDLSATPSQYGSFIPGVGFRMVQYPRLLIQTEGKPILNPSFVSEIAFALHQSVLGFLFPSVHSFFLRSELASQDIDSSWDFGVVLVEVITVVQENQDNTLDAFLAATESNRTAFWSHVAKQLSSVSLTEKQFVVNTHSIALSKSPVLSFLLTECLTITAAKKPAQKNDLTTVLNSQPLFRLLDRHRAQLFAELGIAKEQQELQGHTVGRVTVIPVFL